jgi:hypothetical protein
MEQEDPNIFTSFLTILFFDAFLVYICFLQAVHPIRRVLLCQVPGILDTAIG